MKSSLFAFAKKLSIPRCVSKARYRRGRGGLIIIVSLNEALLARAIDAKQAHRYPK